MKYSAVESVDIAGCVVPEASQVKSLCVTFDSHLTFDRHVADICKARSFHMRALRHIRTCVTDDSAKTMASSLVRSRLAYANAVPVGDLREKYYKASAYSKRRNPDSYTKIRAKRSHSLSEKSALTTSQVENIFQDCGQDVQAHQDRLTAVSLFYDRAVQPYLETLTSGC